MSVSQFIAGVSAFRCESKRYFVLIVIIHHVRPHSHKHGQIVVIQIGSCLHGFSVYKHLESLVLAHVIGGFFVNGTCIVRSECGYPKHHGLLILLQELRLARVGLTGNSGREYIINRCFTPVFFNVYRQYIQAGIGGRSRHSKRFGVGFPFTAHQIQGGETEMCLFFESRKEHTYKPNGFEIADTAHFVGIFPNGYLELIPFHIFRFSVFQRYACFHQVGDEISTYHHVVRTKLHLVLEIFFVLIQGIIRIYILNIRRKCCRSAVFGSGFGSIGRISFGSVVILVPFEDAQVPFVIIFAQVEMIVVARRIVDGRMRVVLHPGHHCGIQMSCEIFHIGFVSRESELILRGKPVEPYILFFACTGRIVKGNNGGLSKRNASPNGSFEILIRIVDGQSVFERFFTILQDILADIAQVEVKVTAVIILSSINKRVHHPEFDVFDVGGFEVRRFDLPHNSSPPILRVQQLSGCRINTCDVQVVRSAFFGVIGQVEQCHQRSSRRINVAIGKKFGFAHLTGIMV